jgi:hypothetical protein
MLGASRRASEGLGGGLGLPVRVFLLGNIPPVGAFVVPLALLSRFLAVLALLIGVRVALGEIDDHRGAGGFFVGGAVEHARMIAHRPLGCKGCGGSLFEFLSGAYISPQPADASQSLSASQSSRVMLPQASANA